MLRDFHVERGSEKVEVFLVFFIKILYVYGLFTSLQILVINKEMENLFPDYFEIKESDVTFESLLIDENLTQERTTELKKYQMLFIPIRNYRNNEGYYFYNSTRDFYIQSKNESPENHFEYYTEKNKYKELLLNSTELYLGTILLKDIILPIAIKLLNKFLLKKLLNNDDKVIINIIVQNTNTNKSEMIEFRGTKQDFEKKVINALQLYSKEGKLILPKESGRKIDVLY